MKRWMKTAACILSAVLAAGTLPAFPGMGEMPGMIGMAADAVLIMRYAVEDKETEVTELGLRNGDTNFDRKTDADDAALILRRIAKQIPSFEEEFKNRKRSLY